MVFGKKKTTDVQENSTTKDDYTYIEIDKLVDFRKGQPFSMYDETKLENRGCTSCGKHGCNSIHCPNCGFANSPELDQEFEFIIKLKDKLKNRKKASN